MKRSPYDAGFFEGTEVHLTWTYTTLDNLPAVNVLSDSGDLGPGQCGGQSCPEKYEDLLAEMYPNCGGVSKRSKINPCGSGRRVIRSTKSFT